MTTETKAKERVPAHQDLRPTPRPHRSDEPYSSILEDDVESSADLGAHSGRVRAPRISRDEVYSTADALLLEGVRPTIDRVRVRLGRGSPNTINEFMDLWWAKLGSRLRDLPGQEFPQLPERVAGSLQRLWNDALESAHEALRESLTRRQDELTERADLIDADKQKLEHERATQTARTSALEEALALARTQLEEANLRARGLEQSLDKREGELQRLKTMAVEMGNKQDAERKSLLEERARLQDRFQASESRWLTEVDRARQQAKAAEGTARDLQAKLSRVLEERDALRTELQALRGDLATAAAVRAQLEARVEAAPRQAGRSASSKTVRRMTQKPVKASRKKVARTNS